MSGSIPNLRRTSSGMVTCLQSVQCQARRMSNPLAELLDRADGARPLLTFYDDSTGERVELSGVTTRNWVAKVANLLVDGLDCQPGDRIAVLLPLHWQAAVVLLGAWTAGVGVTDDPTDADVVFAAGTALPVALEAAPLQVVGLSLRPLGGRLIDVPANVLDFAVEVPSFGDAALPAPIPGAAYDGISAADLAERAGAAAGHLPGERVLTTVAYSTTDGLVHGLLAPLAAGGSVVACRHADVAGLAARAAIERVTATVGVDLPGLSRRD
jgi:uncharacterized protein (TIGR03089 family)